jgi:hypothetical protein
MIWLIFVVEAPVPFRELLAFRSHSRRAVWLVADRASSLWLADIPEKPTDRNKQLKSQGTRLRANQPEPLLFEGPGYKAKS